MFEMGTGVAPPLLPPKNLLATLSIIADYLLLVKGFFAINLTFLSPLNNTYCHTFKDAWGRMRRPRSISTGQLNLLLDLHLRPIYLIIFQGSYLLNGVRYLILG